MRISSFARKRFGPALLFAVVVTGASSVLSIPAILAQGVQPPRHSP
jgi:hypothetical protein